MPHYIIRAAGSPPPLEPHWQAPDWAAAESLAITHFRPESSAHHPRTWARLLHEARGLHGLFQVHDRYVRCPRTHGGIKVDSGPQAS